MSGKELRITNDLTEALEVLNKEDANKIIALKDELTDSWTKKQIFRTETEMRISVLNDGKHPTPASKYWQSVREQNAMFEAVMASSFELRKNKIKRLKIERDLRECTDEIEAMELQVSLDENLYGRASIEQSIHDRVRELELWSEIKAELDDGSFDTKNVNTHQAVSLKKALENRVNTLGPGAGPAEVLNATGPLQTIKRLEAEKLLEK